MKDEPTRVECYGGYRGSERPLAFTWQGNRREVAQIVDRWYEGGLDPSRPEVDYFKVWTVEGEVFLLRYLPLCDTWTAALLPDQRGPIAV